MSAVPITVPHGRPASVLYAVLRSSCACAATASVMCCVPVTTHGGVPRTTELPGLRPISALMVPPVTHVMVEPARIPMEFAAPRLRNDDGGAAMTVTVAVPKIVPLVALTVLGNVPVVLPAVKRPEAATMVPGGLTVVQTGVIA